MKTLSHDLAASQHFLQSTEQGQTELLTEGFIIPPQRQRFVNFSKKIFTK